MRFTRRLIAASLTTVVASMAPAIAAGPAATAASNTIVSGTARGQGVEVNASLLGIGLARVDLSRSTSQINSGGIGGGSLVANGAGIPTQVVAAGSNVVSGKFGFSATSAPPPDSKKVILPNASLPGLLSASAISSGSVADLTPRSDNTASIGDVTVGPALTPIAKTNTLSGIATTRRDGTPTAPEATSVGKSGVEVTTVNLAGVKIVVTGAKVSATAKATGINPSLPGGSSASTTCTVLDVKVGSITVPTPSCTSPTINLGLVKVEFGKAAPPTMTTLSASASIAAITISTTLGQRVVVGAAEATANLSQANTADQCELPGPATASGGAAAEIASLQTADIVRADLALSKAGIDEAGVVNPAGTHTDKAAKADAWTLREQDALVPSEVALFDAHASAPPPSSQTTTLLNLPPGFPVTGTAVETHGQASANPGLTDPHSLANAKAADLGTGGPLGVVLPLSTLDVASSAQSDRNPGNVTSTASETVTTTSATVLGISITVNALQTSATASANGAAGGATAATSYLFAKATIGSIVIDVMPVAGSHIDVSLGGIPTLRVTFGVIDTNTTPDGTSARASVDALKIEALPSTGLSTTVVLGHSEAQAQSPSVGTGQGASVCKDVDIHFDRQSFGDSGRTVAPHQKLWYLVCFRNTSSGQLTNAVITDTLDANLMAVPPLPSGISANGNTLTTSGITLGVGEKQCVTFLVEIVEGAISGSVVRNTATLTATGLPAPVTSNEVVNTVGIVSTQPALFVTPGSQSYNSTTSELTTNLQLQNTPGAGDATGVVVDRIDTTNGVIVVTPLPIAVGDIPAGTAKPFTVVFKLPAGVFGFQATFREVGTGPDGMKYAFD